jgi:hypothetical protein
MTSSNPSEKQQPSVDSNSEAKKHSHEPKSGVAPATGQCPPHPCEKHKEISRNVKRDWIDKATIILEGFGLLILILYAIFTIKIWRASKNAADAAKSAADIAAKELELSQRPWIVPTFQSDAIPLKPNSPLVEPFEFTNTGRTPAKLFETYIVVRRLKAGDVPTFDYSIQKILVQTGLLFPNLPRKVIVAEITPTGQQVILTKNMVDDITTGRACIIIYGKTTYWDMVKNVQHYITFCSLRFTSAFNPAVNQELYQKCSNYNDAD